MFRGKPIIGIAGGIGSGKTFIARLFGELQCFVIHADDQVRQAYDDPSIRSELRQWWGLRVFKADGSVDRQCIAKRIFNDTAERERLEKLLHPWIAVQRDQLMEKYAADPEVRAFIWDTPLLFEAGLDHECDAVVFVDAPRELRIHRVTTTRGWSEADIDGREKLQYGLDKKRNASHYVLVNTADVAACRSQVREIFSRILAK